MSLMGLGELAFGRVVTLDQGTLFSYVGFVYHTLNVQSTYVMKLNLNLDWAFVTRFGTASTVCDI